MKNLKIPVVLALVVLAACASNTPPIPYPAFVPAADLPDSFLAGLPGSRAKIFSSDARTRRASMLLQLPADWNFGTSAAPGKTQEFYVLEGELVLGEFTLQPGGYAYLPAGSLGVSMSSSSGALLLYFLDDVRPNAVIQTPIISNSNLLTWRQASEAVEDFGIAVKVLRSDPGSGARTWLKKVEVGAVQNWRQSSTTEEGFLVSGLYQHAECVAGEAITGEYASGGYFLRPAEAVNGGPEAVAQQTSVWLLRVSEHASYTDNLSCGE